MTDKKPDLKMEDTHYRIGTKKKEKNCTNCRNFHKDEQYCTIGNEKCKNLLETKNVEGFKCDDWKPLQRQPFT